MATDDRLVAAVAKEASSELTAAADRIKHCLDQLSSAQVWQRPDESMNSIGNLVLHLCGNIRQWIVAGIGGAEDIRQRPLEFSERGPIASDQLIVRLDATLAQAREALSRVTAEDLLAQRRIQGFEVTGVQAIIETVAHFRGHSQEIVHMTRCQLGDAYTFAFVPTTPEQGAP